MKAYRNPLVAARFQRNEEGVSGSKGDCVSFGGTVGKKIWKWKKSVRSHKSCSLLRHRGDRVDRIRKRESSIQRHFKNLIIPSPSSPSIPFFYFFFFFLFAVKNGSFINAYRFAQISSIRYCRGVGRRDEKLRDSMQTTKKFSRYCEQSETFSSNELQVILIIIDTSCSLCVTLAERFASRVSGKLKSRIVPVPCTASQPWNRIYMSTFRFSRRLYFGYFDITFLNSRSLAKTHGYRYRALFYSRESILNRMKILLKSYECTWKERIDSIEIRRGYWKLQRTSNIVSNSPAILRHVIA